MKLKKYISPRILVCLAILSVMIVFLAQSDVYVTSVKNGLSLYVVCVLPATFPFFFFSKLLTELNFANDLTGALKKPLRFLYHSSSVGGYILVMSMLCGYPIGAKLLAEFHTHGYIDKKEAKKIAAFTSTGGPVFIIGTVGVAMLKNSAYGFILLLSHYLATFINGFIYRGKDDVVSSAVLPKIDHNDILSKSMTETFLSVGVVGGLIVLFNLFIDIVDNTSLLFPLVFALSKLNVPSSTSEAFLFGLIEMTRGCKMFSDLGYPVYITLPCCGFLITFGGLSVTFQSLTYLSKIKISPAYYLLTKITQGIFSSIFALLFSLFFL